MLEIGDPGLKNISLGFVLSSKEIVMSSVFEAIGQGKYF